MKVATLGLAGETTGSRQPTARSPEQHRGAPCQPRDCRCGQVREVLRLKHAAGLSERGIAASRGISRTTVAKYQPLPSEPFEYAEWKRCRAGLDYHIEVHGHWYSVPYRLIREVVEAGVTDGTVEVFHHGVRVAVHVRNPMRHRHTTVPDHMPSAHRRYADWTPARLRREATRIGPATAHLVELILAAKPHPEQGFRACLGILRLVRSYGADRVEAACQRGIDIGARTYSSVASVLRNNLDRAYRPQSMPDVPPIQHGNIRGGGYYH